MNCLLCESTETHFFSVQQKPIRDYWFCRHCELVFMDSSQHLNSSDEKQRYEQHQNQDSVDYRNYLMPVIERVKKYVPHNSMGLDFGCGPDPVLAQSLTESGYYLNLFDPYFFAEQHSLKQKYSVQY